jgi:hypothetical protein
VFWTRTKNSTDLLKGSGKGWCSSWLNSVTTRYYPASFLPRSPDAGDACALLSICVSLTNKSFSFRPFPSTGTLLQRTLISKLRDLIPPLSYFWPFGLWMGLFLARRWVGGVGSPGTSFALRRGRQATIGLSRWLSDGFNVVELLLDVECWIPLINFLCYYLEGSTSA